MPIKHQCPCCDYFTLEERGNYDICLVCFWEDDGQDLNDIDQHSGPNHQTLREARAHFAEFGACDRAMSAHTLPIAERSRYEYSPREAA